MRTLEQAQLCEKWSYRGAMHIFWKLRHLSPCSQSGNANEHRDLEKIKIKGRKIIHLYVSAGKAWRPSPVLLFESKPIRSLLYESLSSSMFNIVRQHTTFDENTVFWWPETSYNTDFLELFIFARILFHDVNTSRAITPRRFYGSSSYFAWCKILLISNELWGVNKFCQKEREIFKFKGRAAIHFYELVLPAYCASAHQFWWKYCVWGAGDVI